MDILLTINAVLLTGLLGIGYKIYKRLHKPKVILVVGMCQSGSTLLFNILRFMLEKKYQVYSCHYSDYDHDKACYADYVIIKTHKHHIKLHSMADFIFTTKRDLRDTISSAKKRWPKTFNTTQKLIDRGHYNIHLLDIWKEYANYIFKYEAYFSNEDKIIREIGKHLNVKDIDTETIVKQTLELYYLSDLPKKDNFDNETYCKTLLSKHHNTSNGKIGSYRDVLKEDDIIEIENTHKEWLIHNGYLEENYESS